MPVGTIHSAKEQALTYQPLLLATITFPDGTVLRLSTHGLRSADGGFQYGGNDYLPRILNQEIAAVQALSDGGVDVAPQVTLALNDADQFLWTNYEQPKGFKGAKLALTFVFWNVGENDFSSDSVTKFLGICSAPQSDETQLTITATSLLNMQQVTLPPVRIQKRCPWVFPTTKAQRVDGALNEDSWFWECGYSPDVADSDGPGGTAAARGNLNGGSPFSSCNYTKENCQARGMYAKDSLVRITGRFGGVQWDPPKSWRGRAYSSGKFEEGLNSPNEAKYNDPVPLIYGEGWVEPVITNIVGDPNSTRFEALVCYGEIEAVDRVLVNDVEVPFYTGGRDPLFAWWYVTKGTRDGAANGLPGWTDGSGVPTGDPYGSLATITIVVYRQLLESNQIPRVRVKLRGPKLRVYSSDTTFSNEAWPHYVNPVWQAMDALIWAGWDYVDLDIARFRAAAAVADGVVQYKNQHGNDVTHYRFQSAHILRSRRSAADLVRSIRNSARMLLIPNNDNGKLGPLIKQTLAAQQPAPVTGSNDPAPIASKLADGSAANGYVAYRFDESNIIRRSGRSTLNVAQRSNSDTPNRISITYQDSDNDYAQDSLTVVETDALTRNSNQEVGGNFPLEGVISFDHGRRLIGTYLAETLRGNPRNFPAGDAGGTLIFEFETTFKAVHLWMGALCVLDYPAFGITNQLVRVQRIQPAANFETCRITASWHSDEWYTDLWGQEDAPKYSAQRRNGEARPPFPLTGQQHSRTGAYEDAMYGSEESFGLLDRITDAGRRLYAVVSLPRNTFVEGLRPPFVPNQGTTAPTGGSLAGGQSYWCWLVARDTSGESYNSTPPSLSSKIDVPSGTNTNTITIPGIEWDAGTGGWTLYVGTNPFVPMAQLTGAGTPGSITFNGPIDFDDADHPMPDPEFDSIELRLKRLVKAGVAEFESTAAGSTTITANGAGWTVDEWAGYDVSLLANTVGSTDVPENWTWRVVSNSADTLTVSASYGPSPNTILHLVGTQRSRLVFRAKPSAWTVDTITAPKMALVTDELKGKLLRTISGTGRRQLKRIASNTATVITLENRWDVEPDATTRFVVEEEAWDLVIRSGSLDVRGKEDLIGSFPMDATGLSKRPLLCLVVPVDGGGNPSPDALALVRDFYVYYEPVNPAETPSGVGPVVSVALTSPLPPGYASNPDYETDSYGVPLAWAHFTYTPPADAGFSGCDVWVKKSGDPDSSAELRRSVIYDGAGNGVADVSIERPTDDGTYLYHFASRSAIGANPPDFTDGAATESVAIVGRHTLTAAITGATVTAQFENTEQGPFWGIDFQSALPATNQSWTFMNLYIQRQGGYDAVPRKVASWFRSEPSPVRLITRHWGIPFEDEPTLSKDFRFTLGLVKLDGTEVIQANPWGLGTSYKTLTILRPTGGPGVENAPVVGLNTGTTTIQYLKSQDGIWSIRVYAQWTLPSSKDKYAGVRIYLVPDATPGDFSTWLEMGQASASVTEYIGPWMPAPAPGAYTLRFYSVDLRRRENNYQAGVTPVKSVSITLQPPEIPLSRTKGKLTYQGLQSAFEGVEVMTQSGPFAYQRAVWLGSLVEAASTLDLAVTAGNVTCRVANIGFYVGLEGFFIRLLHTNGVTTERVKILSINAGTRTITMDYSEAGTSYFANSFPVGSQVYIDYIGAHLLNLWVGGVVGQPSTAPLYVDKDGSVKLRSVGTKHPSVQITRNNVVTEIQNAADGTEVIPLRAFSTSREIGIRLSSASSLQGEFYLKNPSTGQTLGVFGITGTPGFRTGGSITLRDNNGVFGSAVGGILDALASKSSHRGYMETGRMYVEHDLYFQGTQVADAALLQIFGQYVKHRFFNATFSAAMVKAALREGEFATWYDGGSSWVVFKHADGSGNSFKIATDGLL